MSNSERLQLKFVVKGLHPYSIVEESGYRDLITGASQGDWMPLSRRTLGRRCNDQYVDMKKAMTEKYTRVAYFGITANIWTCKGKSRSFLGSTLHWIDQHTLKRHSDVLACRRFRGSHTFDTIAKLINEIVDEYKIPMEKIVKATTDNGSNFVKAFRMYCRPANDDGESGEELEEGQDPDDDLLEDIDEDVEFLTLAEVPPQPEPTICILPLLHRCRSHTLNLVCSCDVVLNRKNKLQRSAFSKCQALWNAVSRSTIKAEQVHSICGKGLITPVPTRWNSLYDSIIRLLEFEDKLTQIFIAAGSPVVTRNEIDFLIEYVECTKPVCVALDRLQGENGSGQNYGTFYGEVIPTLLSVVAQLEKISQKKPNLCDGLPNILLIQIKNRFQAFLECSMDVKDAMIATISHPYHKLRWLENNAAKLSEMTGVFKTTVLSVALSSNRNSIPTLSTVSVMPTANKSPDDDFFGYSPVQSPTGKTIEDLVESQCNDYLASTETDFAMLH
ncbi:uncharacterized protein LOC118433200 [Folsomia candida]|nr:uncharacterized protein LOC118433200 [Folsomia candida]